MIPALKYLKQYFRPSKTSVELIQSSYVRDGREQPATIYKPRGKRPGKTWIVLHGITYHGSRHKGLMRFARSLAASNHVVFIPEIIEWTQLHVAPELAAPTIKAAVDALSRRDDVDPERIGVFGFSFGATQTLLSTTDADLARRLKVAVAWGGYADIQRVLHFAMTGDHEIDGVQSHIDPDPYGRWIFAANYLTRVPGFEDMERPAKLLHQLAREAGRSGIYAGDRAHDPMKAELANKLSGRERDVYELFAPIGTHDVKAAAELGDKLAETVIPLDGMDPRPYLKNISVPAIITHGRDDRLIPFTESMRLQRSIPDNLLKDFTITSLFSHSGGTEPNLGAVGLVREAGRFTAVLNRILTAL